MSFATPGWDLNATSIAVEPALSNAAKQKKRKLEESSGGQDAATPQVNVEALLSKFHSLDGKNKQKAQHDKPKDVHKKPKIDKKNDSRPQVRKPAKSDAKPSGPKNKFEKHNKSAAAAVSSPSKTSDPEPSTSTSAAAAPVDSEATTEPEQKDKKLSKKEKKQKKNQNQDQDSQHDAPMSTLQTSMKTKLGGARFRWINQQLYTTTGSEALELMENDPSVFDEYHTGFRSQAAQWPTHPLDLIIASLKTDLPARSLIVDLGAGDARLAQELHDQHRPVSYDLVSTNSWVRVAQCSQLGGVPLPGDAAAVADAVVCSLSLMGTDWVNQIRECHRLLRSGGILKIAEVSSRFTDVSAFEKLVQRIGFKQLKKDDSNTHFILFDFKKTEHTAVDKSTGEVEELVEKGSSLLKPCLYKKRG